MVPSDANKYQRTEIKMVKGIDVKPVAHSIQERCGVKFQEFVLYGELMCNSGFYKYCEMEKFNVFGAMVKVQGEAGEVAKKMAAKGFAVQVRGGNEDEEDPSQVMVMLMINQELKDLLDKCDIPTVHFLGQYKNLYEMAIANFDWMLQGNGEGIVLAHGSVGEQKKITKWKIGAEANQTNLSFLRAILDELEDDKEMTLFGENTAKAIDLFNKMYEVQKSNLVMGQPPKPKKEKGGAKALPVKAVLSPEMAAEYSEAIKSAKSKFDHAKTFFAKNMKGVEEFSKLIAAECLNDIKAQNIDEHNRIIKDIIKAEFIEFQRAKKK
jgi:hypothetical protein